MHSSDATIQNLRQSRSALIAELEAGGVAVKGNGLKCPFGGHDDRHPSAGIWRDDAGVWRTTCHSCGQSGDVFDLRALREGRDVADVLCEARANAGSPSKAPARPATAKTQPKRYRTLGEMERRLSGQSGASISRYEYRNADGTLMLLVFRLNRTDGTKRFVQARPDGDGYVFGGLRGSKTPLFRAVEIAKTDGPVVVTEGEKAALALVSAGVEGTTSPGGAKNADGADWALLAGRDVVIWPDNDDAGESYATDVITELLTLKPRPTIRRLDPAALGMGQKEDAADFVLKCEDPDSIREAIREVIDLAEPVAAPEPEPGPAASLARLFQAESRGERQPLALPWSTVDAFSRALSPGTVTIIAGSPGSGKSLALLEMALKLHSRGIPVAIFEAEEDRDFHARRTLAILAGNAGILDGAAVMHDPTAATAALDKHGALLDSFGRRISEAGDTQPALDGLADWAQTQASAGVRFIAIDPISVAAKSSRGWEDDVRFIGRVKRTAQTTGACVVLVAHPAKGASRNQIDLDSLAGGAALGRLCQCALWLERHDPRTVAIASAFGGVISVQSNRTMRILKARNARGAGAQIAFEFSDDMLRLTELGAIVKPAKDAANA